MWCQIVSTVYSLIWCWHKGGRCSKWEQFSPGESGPLCFTLHDLGLTEGTFPSPHGFLLFLICSVNFNTHRDEGEVKMNKKRSEAERTHCHRSSRAHLLFCRTWRGLKEIFLTLDARKQNPNFIFPKLNTMQKKMKKMPDVVGKKRSIHQVYISAAQSLSFLNTLIKDNHIFIL